VLAATGAVGLELLRRHELSIQPLSHY